MPGDEDDLLHSTFHLELPLECEAVESRQLRFEHDARRAVVRHACQVLGGAGKDLDGVVLRSEQFGEACPGRLVVIHHEDARLKPFHASCRCVRHGGLCAEGRRKDGLDWSADPIFVAPIMALRATESEVVGPRIDLALATRAHHVAGAILVGAKKRTTFLNALFLCRLGGIEWHFGALRVSRDVAVGGSCLKQSGRYQSLHHCQTLPAMSYRP